MFDTQKNKSTKNSIAYAAPKNKTMVHSMILNNRISCMLGIPMLGFNKYQHSVLNFMDLNMIPTLKQFLKS